MRKDITITINQTGYLIGVGKATPMIIPQSELNITNFDYAYFFVNDKQIKKISFNT